MAEDNIYTEQELSKMADELLNAAGETELIPEPPKPKKSSRKKTTDPQEAAKSPEERLNELFEKGKKAGKLTTKELELLEELNLDGEAVDKFYETLEKAGIDIDVGSDDLLPPLDEVMPYWEPGWAHDEFLWKMACVTDSCAILQRFTTNRRMHSGNATNIKKRTRDWRLRQLDDMARWNASLKRYAQDKRLSPEGMSRIEKFDEALALRKKLLTKRNPFLWLKLWLRYADCYPRKKGLYLDLYLVFFKESHRN